MTKDKRSLLNRVSTYCEPQRLIDGPLRVLPGTTVVMGHDKMRVYPRIAYGDLLCWIEHVENVLCQLHKKSHVTDVNLADSVVETMTFRGSNSLLYLP